MKRSAIDMIGEGLRRRALPPKELESAIARVWRHVERATHDVAEDNVSEVLPHHRSRPNAWLQIAIPAAAAAIVIVVLSLFWPTASDGLVESGSVVRTVRDRETLLGQHDRISFGDVLRSGDNAGALSLADGTRVDLRQHSEIALERAVDGVRIRLHQGSVIVNAAKQRNGHLYVETKDLSVSVVGTVFLVNAEREGSRVAVIEGEVRVKHGGLEKKLLPGEQAVTNPSMGFLSPESYQALLQQSVVTLPPAASKRLEFDVAAIKPSGPDSPPFSITSSPGRLTTANTPLKMLITWAYDISSDRLVGAPDWLDSVRYDITANVPDRTADEEPGRERLKLMMQSLLAQRFKLLFHRETRELAMYVLATDKSGPKIRMRDPGNDLGRNTFNMPGSGRLVGAKVTTTMLAKVLAEQLGREVEDRTGLQGIFDFTLEWAAAPNPSTLDRPSIFTAVREQLGLELISRKGPVEVLFIDQIERSPTPN